MAKILTLPNWRQESDGTIRVRLKDSGVAADWSGFEDIRAYMYSNAGDVITVYVAGRSNSYSWGGMLTACVNQKMWTN